ncbi:hypothetical protein FA15DRAFT_705881 [Coprinopsis marcescibilis]|uniref:Uncharacterized protein n=1 Tax=Coprinopsis marcescibilis TaxID=230819 RepID=A0A5C3KSY8_COPMA|nr:hypothetical protein FA15DRAFT_705881 [Coprinopsis marcescibilis]
MKLTTAFVSSALLTLATVRAVDLRFYDADDCTGAFLVCTGLPPNFCCTGPEPAASVKASTPTGVFAVYALEEEECEITENWDGAFADGCIVPEFIAHSGFWLEEEDPAPRRRRQIRQSAGNTSKVPAPPNPGQRRKEETCRQPDSFGVVDKATGAVVVRKIPAAQRVTILEAFGKKDDALLTGIAQSLPALTTTHVALALLTLSSTARASVDIRLYDTNNCTGRFLVCTDLPPEACCTGPDAAASVKTTIAEGVGAVYAFEEENCVFTVEGWDGVFGDACIVPLFSAHSGYWLEGEKEEKPAPSALVSNTGKVTEPGEKRKLSVWKIRVGKGDEGLEALEKKEDVTEVVEPL